MWTLFPCFTKKSHTREEGWAHLRISFCYSLIFEKPEKSEFWKIWKKLLKILSFYTWVPKTTMIWGTVFEIRRETKFFLSCLAIFYPSKFQKNEKNTWRYHHSAHASQKIWLEVPEIWCVTDARTVGRKKWHIEVGAPPKNNFFFLVAVNYLYKKMVSSKDIPIEIIKQIDRKKSVL